MTDFAWTATDELLPFVSVTCEGERCWCGEPAVKKVGEEIPFDDPDPARHNLTSYVCARHYAELMGPIGAKQVGYIPTPTGEVLPTFKLSEQATKEIDAMLDAQAKSVDQTYLVGGEVLPSMIEAVARAICRHSGRGHEDDWESYVPQARAAIEAMNHPAFRHGLGVDEAERVNDLVVRITEHAIRELDADEENTLQIEGFGAAVEREILSAISATPVTPEGEAK